MIVSGIVTVNPEAVSCKVDGQPVRLSKSEYLVLTHLMERKGKLVDRATLSSKYLRKDSKPRAVDVTVSRLRKKLGPASTMIRTINGFGYIWVEPE